MIYRKFFAMPVFLLLWKTKHQAIWLQLKKIHLGTSIPGKRTLIKIIITLVDSNDERLLLIEITSIKRG